LLPEDAIAVAPPFTILLGSLDVSVVPENAGVLVDVAEIALNALPEPSGNPFAIPIDAEILTNVDGCLMPQGGPDGQVDTIHSASSVEVNDGVDAIAVEAVD
jgi:hypothetical protein